MEQGQKITKETNRMSCIGGSITLVYIPRKENKQYIIVV